MEDNYKSFANKINELYSSGEYAAAIELIEGSIDLYPEHLDEMMLDLAVVNARSGNREKALEILTDQLERGIWYPREYFRDHWETEEFKPFAKAWEELRREINEKSEKKLVVITPEGYDREKKYPLFIALHGWGEDAAMFMEFWTSERLRKDYLLAIVQSSQRIGTINYCWNDTEIAHREISEAYEELLKEYSIDQDQTFIGGFSQGSTIAMEAALIKSDLPLKGFIALNPEKPEGFAIETVQRAKERGIRGIILTGDKDGDYEVQRSMMTLFKEVDFSCKMVVKENFGHWFPEDLGERIDRGLQYIEGN